MLKAGKEELICDLAETYNVYNYKKLPPSEVAIFSKGLHENSRIKMKMSNQVVPLNELLLAGINVKLAFLVWAKTKDAESGINRPKSLVDIWMGESAKESDIVSFESVEEFEKYRNEVIANGHRTR